MWTCGEKILSAVYFLSKAREFTRYSQRLGISLLYCTNYQYILFCLCRHHVNSLHYSNFLCFCRETEGHLLECLQAQSIFLFILFVTKCLLIWTRRFWYSEMVQSVLAFKRPQKPQLHLITTVYRVSSMSLQTQGLKYGHWPSKNLISCSCHYYHYFVINT